MTKGKVKKTCLTLVILTGIAAGGYYYNESTKSEVPATQPTTQPATQPATLSKPTTLLTRNPTKW